MLTIATTLTRVLDLNNQIRILLACHVTKKVFFAHNASGKNSNPLSCVIHRTKLMTNAQSPSVKSLVCYLVVPGHRVRAIKSLN